MRSINFLKYQPRFVLVEVPEDARDISISYSDIHKVSTFYFATPKPIMPYEFNNINGRAEIIGKLSSVLASEQMCEGLVDERDPVNGLFLIYDSSHTTDMWVNNEGGLNSMTRTEYGLAKESLLSRLKAEGDWSTVEPVKQEIDYAEMEQSGHYLTEQEIKAAEKMLSDKYESALSHYLKPENYLVIKIIEP